MKVLKGLLLFCLIIWQVSASTIDKIEAVKDNEIILTSSEDISFSSINVEWEIKLLKDVPISFNSIDLDNSKKVLLNLTNDLDINTSYSLITIIGTDWNIDFNISDTLEWEILNLSLLEWEEWIEKINILNSRTIELYYTSDLKDDVFEFKILSDIWLDSLSSEWNNKLKLNVSKKLELSTSYIIMILALEDALWNTISYNEDLHEIITPSNFWNIIEETPIVEEPIIIEENKVPEIIEPITEVDPDEEIINEMIKEDPVVDWNIAEVAMGTEETPETGTSTWILLLLVLIWNFLFFFRKK